jgi:hypothetical protein
MVRWSDLHASLQAGPRVMLRWDLWWLVLRRLLGSGVFAGYALLAALLAWAGRPLLTLAAASLLLPYAVWALTVPVAMLLPEHLALPPAEVDEEPPFIRYLLWNLPLMATACVLAGLFPLLASGSATTAVLYGYAAVLLAAPSALKMVTRGTLAAYYDGDTSRAFVAATRLERLLAVPLVLAAAWLLASGVPLLRALPQLHGLWRTLPPPAWIALLALAVLVVLLFAAVVSTGALLLACARISVDAASQDTATAFDDRGPRSMQPTRPMPAGRPGGRDADLGWGRRLARGCAMLVVLAGTLYLARLPLVDAFLEHDAMYRTAADAIDRLQGNNPRRYGPVLDAAVVSERLRAGYIVAACDGDLERAGWLAQLEEPQPLDQARVLACAACSGQKGTVDWLLRTHPQVRADEVVLATAGDPRRPRTALSCAARVNDLALARQLLRHGATPRDLEGAAASIHIAASRQHWDMVRLLLQKDRGAAAVAAFAALDAAYARDPRRPAEILPRLLAAGVPVLVADEHRRTLLHWAALRNDLPLAHLLLLRSGAAEVLTRADRQGALPWMYVLRRAQLAGQPLDEDGAELLRLLLPPGADVNQALGKPLEAGSEEAFPAGWNAGAATLNDPAARATLGPALDFGQLPPNPAQWWQFRGMAEAQAFVHDLTPAQLARAEHPDAPPGLAPKPLSQALAEAGWSDLAREVQQGLRPRRR